MKIAVLADIHSNHNALETCVTEAVCRGAEEFLFLGDYLGDLACPEKTLAILNRIKKSFPCTFIRGNKEDYWIGRKNSLHPDRSWMPGSTSTGMLAYVYERLTKRQIEEFEKLPISKTMRYPGLPAFTICHGSPWRVNESMREDYDYIDELTGRLEAELTICGHFHIQCEYRRHGKRIVNPGSVGVPLKSGGKTQFLMLSDVDGRWVIDFVTLPYDRERTIREMDEEHLDRQAPGWYRITKSLLLGSDISHVKALSMAAELCERETGSCNWSSIPETYWDMALKELGL